LKEIQNNLLEDIQESQRNVDNYLRLDSIYRKTLDFENQWTNEDFVNGKFKKIGHQFFDFKINKNGFENLMRNAEKLPKEYEPILRDFKTLYVSLDKKIEIANKRVQNTVYTHLDFKYNQNWVLDWYKNNKYSEEEINYYINDDHYKRHIIKFLNDRNIVFRNSQLYRVKAIEMYIKIDSILSEENSKLPLNELGYVALNEEEVHYGTYISSNDSLKLFKHKNYLFSINNSDEKLKHYKISDSLYMYMQGSSNYPVIWKYSESNGKINLVTLSDYPNKIYRKVE